MNKLDRKIIVKMYETATNRYPHYSEVMDSLRAKGSSNVYNSMILKDEVLPKFINSSKILVELVLRCMEHLYKMLMYKTKEGTESNPKMSQLLAGGFPGTFLRLFETDLMTDAQLTIFKTLMEAEVSNNPEYYKPAQMLIVKDDKASLRGLLKELVSGGHIYTEYVRQRGSENIVMSKDTLAQLNDEHMADGITIRQLFASMGKKPHIIIVPGYTAVIIDFPSVNSLNFCIPVIPSMFTGWEDFYVDKIPFFVSVIIRDDDETVAEEMSALDYLRKNAFEYVGDSWNSDFIIQILKVLVNSTLMVNCSNLEYNVEEELIKKDKRTTNKKKLKKNRTVVRDTDHTLSFIDMNTLRFKRGWDKQQKEEVDSNKPTRKPITPHMRIGHFRSQWYKNDEGKKYTKIIFIRPTAVRGGVSNDDRYIFRVVR